MDKPPDFSPLDKLNNLLAQTRAVTQAILLEMANLAYPQTPESAEDFVWNRANEMEQVNELPYGVSAWDVYDDFQRYWNGE